MVICRDSYEFTIQKQFSFPLPFPLARLASRHFQTLPRFVFRFAAIMAKLKGARKKKRSRKEEGESTENKCDNVVATETERQKSERTQNADAGICFLRTSHRRSSTVRRQMARPPYLDEGTPGVGKTLRILLTRTKDLQSGCYFCAASPFREGSSHLSRPPSRPFTPLLLHCLLSRHLRHTFPLHFNLEIACAENTNISWFEQIPKKKARKLEEKESPEMPKSREYVSVAKTRGF